MQNNRIYTLHKSRSGQSKPRIEAKLYQRLTKSKRR